MWLMTMLVLLQSMSPTALVVQAGEFQTNKGVSIKIQVNEAVVRPATLPLNVTVQSDATLSGQEFMLIFKPNSAEEWEKMEIQPSFDFGKVVRLEDRGYFVFYHGEKLRFNGGEQKFPFTITLSATGEFSFDVSAVDAQDDQNIFVVSNKEVVVAGDSPNDVLVIMGQQSDS